MEGKTMVKLSHVVAILLLASLFQPMMARDLSDEIIEILRLPLAKENQVKYLDDSEPICPGKQSWPELVGQPALTAQEIIYKENPIVTNVEILVPVMPVTGDFVCGRVRIIANFQLIVVQTPRMG
ncbi:proteinase inhibitor I-B-like [Lycium barbarum]|uniref:proteinase inhibitor I-B-like n=1 Tax=Lycium barbarum TaxID=112863 RepID=UPI00293F755F|nr:proteinase inhibitor I-B-like [Lycium barbarum]